MKTTQALKKRRGQSRLKKQELVQIRKRRSALDLVFAFVSISLLILLMFYSSPSDVANFILPSSYLPLLLLVFFSSFFLFKFILLNQGLAFCIAFNLLLLLFFYLQNLIFNYYLIIILILAPLVWMIFHQIEKRLL
jgi:hypothetical protein